MSQNSRNAVRSKSIPQSSSVAAAKERKKQSVRRSDVRELVIAVLLKICRAANGSFSRDYGAFLRRHYVRSILGENFSSRTVDESIPCDDKSCLGKFCFFCQRSYNLYRVSRRGAAIWGRNTPTENQSAIHSETATAVTPGHSLTPRPDENSRSTNLEFP